MAAAITFVAFIVIAGFLFMRMLQARDANPDFEPAPRQPRRLSSKERKLERLREFEATIPERPTIQELMQQEVEATGVDTIPGGDGLEIPVRLKVWHRDAHVRIGCASGALRFVVHDGVDPTAATEDHVMLVCDTPAEAGAPDATAVNADLPNPAETDPDGSDAPGQSDEAPTI